MAFKISDPPPPTNGSRLDLGFVEVKKIRIDLGWSVYEWPDPEPGLYVDVYWRASSDGEDYGEMLTRKFPLDPVAWVSVCDEVLGRAVRWALNHEA